MNVLHLVQHFKIGGLEKMAVTLMQKSQFADSSVVVSLEGTLDEAVEGWPQLASFEGRLICLNKPAKFDMNTVSKLTEVIKKFNIDVIHSHHIGPMLYASMEKISNSFIELEKSTREHRYLVEALQNGQTDLAVALTLVHLTAIRGKLEAANE